MKKNKPWSLTSWKTNQKIEKTWKLGKFKKIEKSKTKEKNKEKQKKKWENCETNCETNWKVKKNVKTWENWKFGNFEKKVNWRLETWKQSKLKIAH